MQKSGHNSCTYTSSNWQSYDPSQNYIAENRPIDVFSRSESANKDDWAHFAMSGRNRHPDVARNKDSSGGTKFNGKATAKNNSKKNIIQLVKSGIFWTEIHNTIIF